MSSAPVRDSAGLCPQCGGTGWYYTGSGVVRCDCARNRRATRLLDQARIPARYTHCELSNFEIRPPYTTRSIEKAKLDAEKFAEEYPAPQPFGLLFVGPQGVGKTHLAVGILKRLIVTKSVQGMFRTFPELLRDIQHSYNPVSQSSELSLMQPVLDAEVLVLDELGAQNPTSWVRDTVSYVLNYRYNENKVTILTTNYTDPEDFRSGQPALADSLSDRIGDRMRSRLYEMCKTIKMEGRDFRREVKQAEHQF